ncbi:hypothetical protein L6452_29539 [Arctium lappa]|uniref:Uncharacterized protein n=1 Tax=Arctium lappa TaxID=4217 RepID=A0ACB8ZGR3_ARCLA|nr:hypothetical protein L6452_29539 [Arctium lappa]
MPLIHIGGIFFITSPATGIYIGSAPETVQEMVQKEAAKAEKLWRHQEVAATSAAASVGGVSIDCSDPLAANYGDLSTKDYESKVGPVDRGQFSDR